MLILGAIVRLCVCVVCVCVVCVVCVCMCCKNWRSPSAESILAESRAHVCGSASPFRAHFLLHIWQLATCSQSHVVGCCSAASPPPAPVAVMSTPEPQSPSRPPATSLTPSGSSRRLSISGIVDVTSPEAIARSFSFVEPRVLGMIQQTLSGLTAAHTAALAAQQATADAEKAAARDDVQAEVTKLRQVRLACSCVSLLQLLC